MTKHARIVMIYRKSRYLSCGMQNICLKRDQQEEMLRGGRKKPYA